MQVIMLKDVAGVGQRDTLQEVADGYALNNLIPRALAIQATPERLTELKKRKANEEASKQLREAAWARDAEALHGARILVPARANQLGHLYKQLSPSLIIEAIKQEFGIDVPPEAIVLSAPIRKMGDTEVEVRFGLGRARITISVIKAD